MSAYVSIRQHTSAYREQSTTEQKVVRDPVHGSSSGEIGMMIFIAWKRDVMFDFLSSSSRNVFGSVLEIGKSCPYILCTPLPRVNRIHAGGALRNVQRISHLTESPLWGHD
jgi:hypothetical protein